MTLFRPYQEGFPTAEEFVICNKELNLMGKISFSYLWTTYIALYW